MICFALVKVKVEYLLVKIISFYSFSIFNFTVCFHCNDFVSILHKKIKVCMMFIRSISFCTIKYYTKQECIPVGCVPPTLMVTTRNHYLLEAEPPLETAPPPRGRLPSPGGRPLERTWDKPGSYIIPQDKQM